MDDCGQLSLVPIGPMVSKEPIFFIKVTDDDVRKVMTIAHTKRRCGVNINVTTTQKRSSTTDKCSYHLLSSKSPQD